MRRLEVNISRISPLLQTKLLLGWGLIDPGELVAKWTCHGCHTAAGTHIGARLKLSSAWNGHRLERNRRRLWEAFRHTNGFPFWRTQTWTCYSMRTTGRSLHLQTWTWTHAMEPDGFTCGNLPAVMESWLPSAAARNMSSSVANLRWLTPRSKHLFSCWAGPSLAKALSRSAQQSKSCMSPTSSPQLLNLL